MVLVLLLFRQKDHYAFSYRKKVAPFLYSVLLMQEQKNWPVLMVNIADIGELRPELVNEEVLRRGTTVSWG